MQLYEKLVSAKGKVSYREYKPEYLPDMEIDREDVVSILMVFGVAMFEMAEGQLKEKDALRCKIKVAREKLKAVAEMGFRTPRGCYVDLGVSAWMAAIKAIQEGLLRVR